jgi:hypothetical protein
MSNLLQHHFSNDEILFQPADHAMWQKLYLKQIVNLQDKVVPQFFSNMNTFSS